LGGESGGEVGTAVTRRDSATPAPARYCVGIIHYQSYRDLETCLGAIARQSLAAQSVWVIDADGDPAELAKFKAQHPAVRFQASANRGYAAAANELLSRAQAEEPAVDFCLLLNPDVVLDPAFSEQLVEALIAHPRAALGAGKLLRPDRRTLDSAGIELPAHRRPRDRGSETPDRGQYDRGEYVFGASGAAMLVRCSALAELALEGEVFDEDFFLYHEDTDLSWRSHVMGWRVYYEPRATAVHARGWQKGHRFRVPAKVRRHSFKNHYLQLIKNESISGFLFRFPILLAWEALRFAHAVIRDREVLPGYADAWSLAGRAFHKRGVLRGQRRRRSRLSKP
jgi:GT2 family glycosyltransferase